IQLMANVELPGEIETILDEAAAGGIGLLRSEFLFMARPTLPTEDEQFEMLIDLVRKIGSRHLTIRTLDIGADKAPACLQNYMNEQENPSLGIRGIRFSLTYPELFKTQIRAIMRISA